MIIRKNVYLYLLLRKRTQNIHFMWPAVRCVHSLQSCHQQKAAASIAIQSSINKNDREKRVRFHLHVSGRYLTLYSEDIIFFDLKDK
jgi:hypothetical protein